jgi:hypothetical protein
MKTRLLTFLGLILVFVPAAFAQQVDETTIVYQKIAKMDALYNILPLFLTKAQIDQLLPVLEKARANVRDAKKHEDEFFKNLEPDVDEANRLGFEKQQIPSDKMRQKFINAMISFAAERETVSSNNTDLALATFDKVCNVGQIKAAANTVNIKFYVPTAKVEDLSLADKERYFVRFVLLDPVVYEVLLELDKTAPAN